ncbi:MAG: aspartate kinase [Chloroflexi bacterium]|nr:aspartate kinase [Chloroflexota bacterium]
MSTLTMKFGGTSVGSPEAIATVVRIVNEAVQEGHRVVVVVSAMAGVTDMLITSVREAAAGNRWVYLSTSQKIRDRHIEAANLLIQPGSDRNAIIAEIETLMEQHVEMCNAINMLGESTLRIDDAVFAFGERLSSRVIAAAMRSQGLKAKQYDANQLVITNDHFTTAIPIWDETETHIRAELLPALDRGIVPVITGFVGGTKSGHITTLGRGGSDYSGAIFATYTDSDELVIWTDVDGVMTTDPRVDPRARVLPSISYQEVGELAFYGAKVLHPKTVQPILNRGIPMRVRNTFNTSHPGTLITKVAEPINTIIKAVTSIKAVSLLTVSGKGMIGVPGIAGRTFLATAHAGTSILMISQASSEQSFCFVVPQERAKTVADAIEREMNAEIAREDVDGVDILNNVGVITVVGAGMRGTPGVAGRVFSTLGNHRINVIAIAQGASECSISFVISEEERDRAVLALHELALEESAVAV